MDQCPRLSDAAVPGGLLWRQAGDAVDDVDSALAACEVEPFTGQPEDPAAEGKIEIGIEDG